MKQSNTIGLAVLGVTAFCLGSGLLTCTTTKKTKPCKQCPQYTQTLDSLKQRIQTDSATIDLMEYEMKRLEQENQVFGSMLAEKDLIHAMIQVESRDNDSAYCAEEDAVGCLQIRPIMVNEVNRICKILGIKKAYSLEDRWSRSESISMLKIFVRFYDLKEFEEIARCWNGGPLGMDYASTEGYWNKVQNEMI